MAKLSHENATLNRSWQCHYKLVDGYWQCTSNRRARIEAAVSVTTDFYDETRYRQRLGLAYRVPSFAHLAHLAHAVLEELWWQMDAVRARASIKAASVTLNAGIHPNS